MFGHTSTSRHQRILLHRVCFKRDITDQFQASYLFHLDIHVSLSRYISSSSHFRYGRRTTFHMKEERFQSERPNPRRNFRLNETTGAEKESKETLTSGTARGVTSLIVLIALLLFQWIDSDRQDVETFLFFLQAT